MNLFTFENNFGQMALYHGLLIRSPSYHRPSRFRATLSPQKILLHQKIRPCPVGPGILFPQNFIAPKIPPCAFQIYFRKKIFIAPKDSYMVVRPVRVVLTIGLFDPPGW